MTHHRILQQIPMLPILALGLVLAQVLALEAGLLALLRVAPIQVAIAKVALALDIPFLTSSKVNSRTQKPNLKKRTDSISLSRFKMIITLHHV